jgi:hypothetical protein
VKYAWIEVHAALWPIEVMCRMLEVSASGCFEARCRAPGGTPRQAADAATAARMAVIQKHHRGRYGRRRMRRALRQAGDLVNHKRVSRLMREHGLQSRMRRGFRVVTTGSRHGHPIAQNVLARDFAAGAPNRMRRTDIIDLSPAPVQNRQGGRRAARPRRRHQHESVCRDCGRREAGRHAHGAVLRGTTGAR